MNRYAHCHFCDDIRFELGNKVSLIGLYAGEMHVNAIPIVIPKLCFYVLFATEIADPVKSLSIKVADKDQILVQQDVNPEELEAAFKQAAKRGTEDDPMRVLTVGMNLVASPFVVEKENTVTVSVLVDGEDMIAGRLRVRQAVENPPSS